MIAIFGGGVAGAFLASVLMTLSSEQDTSLTGSEREIGKSFLEASSDYGAADEITLRKVPVPKQLADNVTPELDEVLAAVRWYHAMLRLAMTD